MKLFQIISLLFMLIFLEEIAAQDTDLSKQERHADSLFLYGNYTESLRAFQAILDNDETKKDTIKLSKNRLNIIKILIRSGKFEEAEKTLTKIKITQNSLIQANKSNYQGLIELHKGQNEKAQESFEKALKIYETAKSDYQTKMAEVYSNLGLVLWNTGRTKSALNLHHKALYIRKKYYGERHPETAGSYNNIGLTYGLTKEALKYYQKALFIYAQIYSENHPTTANVYTNIALIYRAQKNPEFALFNLKKALKIWQNLHHNEQHPNEAFLISNIGQIYADEKKYDQALNEQQKALKIYHKYYGEKHPEIAGIYNLIGSIYATQKAYTKALDAYQSALIANVPNFQSTRILQNPNFENYYRAEVLLNSLHLKARAWEGLHYTKTLRFKDLQEAIQLLEKCDTLANHIRQTRTHQKDKIALSEMMSEVYGDAVRICLALADYAVRPRIWKEKAFYFAERSKASVLLSAVTETRAKTFAGIPKNILQKEQDLKSELARFEQKLAENIGTENESKWRNQIVQFNRVYDKFTLDMEKNYPQYYHLKYNPTYLQIKDLQELIPENTVLISYFTTQEELYIFRVFSDELEILEVPKIRKFDKKLISLRNAIFYQAHQKFIQTGQLLYQQLFPKKLPKRIKKLIIIPDGRLGTIPFEVLLTKKTEKVPRNKIKEFLPNVPYLIRKYDISYLYATSLLSISPLQKQPTSGILLFAPVRFKISKSEDYEYKNLPSLPYTETEVLNLEKLFVRKGIATESRLYETASEKFIKSDNLEKYKYIHLATHGAVNESTPELSRVFLSNSDGQEDGNLFSGEIYNLKINSDLVTLSACQTGLGKIKKGEGIIGLSRALLYAGAKNMTLSLWRVSDASTADLMQNYYQNFLETDTPNFAQALRNAKLKMIRNGQFSAPYYWASFILVGK